MNALFTNLGSQLGSILTIIGIVSAIGAFCAYLIHNPTPSKDKWKVVGGAILTIIASLVIFTLVSNLWSKPLSSQVANKSLPNLIYTYYNTKNPDNFALWDMAWSPDSTRIASADAMGAVRIWDATTGKPYVLHVVPTPTWYGIIVAWSPNGKYIATANHYQVYIWDTATGNSVFTINVRKTSLSPVLPLVIAWSPNSRYIALTNAGTVHVFDVNTRQDILTYTDFQMSSSVLVDGMVWSPNGQDIASWYSDGTIEEWNADFAVNFGGLLLTRSSHSGQVESIAWSPNGQDIAAGYQDGTLQMWNAYSGVSENILGNVSLTCSAYPANGVRDVAWSPDGKSIAYTCLGKQFMDVVHLWNSSTQKFSLLPGEYGIWSPDGKYFATLYNDAVQVYQVE